MSVMCVLRVVCAVCFARAVCVHVLCELCVLYGLHASYELLGLDVSSGLNVMYVLCCI